jgi:nitroreductase
MNLKAIIKNRKSSRWFLEKPVKEDEIIDILDYAKYAPSGVNMQPWIVEAVSKKTKEKIISQFLERFDSGDRGKMDYQYYPKEWVEPYKSRRVETGIGLYKCLKIDKNDKIEQAKQWRKNFEAFNAPMILFFFIDSSLDKGSYLDYGMFLQNILLLCTQKGLATCTQAALAQYPDIVKKELNIDDKLNLLCGISIGYEDKSAQANSFKTSRVETKEFVNFHD